MCLSSPQRLVERSETKATGEESTARAATASPSDRLFGKVAGDPGGSRTPNLVLRTDLLYPVELRGHVSRETSGVFCPSKRRKILFHSAVLYYQSREKYNVVTYNGQYAD